MARTQLDSSLDIALGLASSSPRFRIHDPERGRFEGVDWFEGVAEDPLTMNKYAYTHNDPVNNVDPSGKFLISLALGSFISTKLNATWSQKAIVLGGTALLGFLETIGYITLGQYLSNGRVPAGKNVPLTSFGQVGAYTGSYPSRQSVVQRLGEPAAGVTKKPANWPIPNQVFSGDNKRVNRAALAANQLFGPAGCGPCVGVLFVTPTELVGVHFNPGVDSPRRTLARLGPFPAGTRAVLNGATAPQDVQFSEFAIDEIMRWIGSDPNITIDGFHDSASVFADKNGSYYDF